MITDDNSKFIEWVDSYIKVHHLDCLKSEVLQKYFSHSKFASFQCQLNHFEFLEIAGIDKMSPCSYVNEQVTLDIRSLLLFKQIINGWTKNPMVIGERMVYKPGKIISSSKRCVEICTQVLELALVVSSRRLLMVTHWCHISTMMAPAAF